MESTRIEAEGADLNQAVELAMDQLGVQGKHEMEYEFDKDHFRSGANTVKIFAWCKDPIQLEAVQYAVDFVQGFLDRFGVEDGSIRVDEAEEKTTLSISAGDLANILIGQEGKNLDALQLVLTGALNHHGYDHKVVLDVEEYRTRRETRLREQAVYACRDALNDDRPVCIGPFNSYERRIVHLVVKDQFDDQLESRSVGDKGKTREIKIRRRRD